MKIDRVTLDAIAQSLYGCAATLSSNHWELSVGVVASFILLSGATNYIPLFVHPLMMWVLATIVYLCWTRRLYIHCCQTQKYSINPDLLAFLGITLVYGYSVMRMVIAWYEQRAVLSSELYFNTSTWLITLMLLFDYVRAYLCDYSLRPLQELMRLLPSTAKIWRDNEWRQVPIDQITIGDRIQIVSGDTIPADGTIIIGASSVNEGVVTGSVTMAFKDTGDRVIAGTKNLSGSFEMRAQNIDQHTVLAKIIELFKHAVLSTAIVINIVKRYALICNGAVIFLAIVTFLIWFIYGPVPHWMYALNASASVLCIAAIYTLFLTLVILMVAGIGHAVQIGVLIKNAKAFDFTRRINMIVFNKTGTVTYGRYNVQKFEVVANVEEIFTALQWPIPAHVSAQSYVKVIVRAIEALSDHAVALAVADYLSEYKLLMKSVFDEQEIEKFEVLPGLGVRCFVQGHQVLIGSKQFMEQEQISITLALDNGSKEWAALAHTVSFVAFDNQLVAYFSVADGVREGVSDAIAQLKAKGIKTILITGDDQVTAHAIAQSIGIDQIIAQVAPHDKASYVRELRISNQIVAMVADGVQDSQALVAADVGIAFCSGLDSGFSVADIVLLREDMVLIPKIIMQAKGLMHALYQIVIIGAIYNSIAIPIAMGIWYLLYASIVSPLYAGVIMVIFNLLLMMYALRRHIE